MKVQKQTKEQEPVENAHLLYKLKNLEDFLIQSKPIIEITEKKED